MYFISKGSCIVKVKTQNVIDMGTGTEGDEDFVDPVKVISELRAGDHFGEIALIYGCKRTASVETKNYSTLAQLTKAEFTEL